MQFVRTMIAAALVAAGWLASIGAAQTCHGQIVINEILADPGIDWNGDGVIDSRTTSGSRSSTPGPARRCSMTTAVGWRHPGACASGSAARWWQAA
jgi:hypothetical protein